MATVCTKVLPVVATQISCSPVPVGSLITNNDEAMADNNDMLLTVVELAVADVSYCVYVVLGNFSIAETDDT